MERGIVVGKSGRNEIFIASNHDILVAFSSIFDLGDCVEFSSVKFHRTSKKQVCDRRATDIAPCSQFVEFQIDNKRNNCRLIVNIVDVDEQYALRCGRNARVIYTDFLQEVLDSDTYPLTDSFSRDELIGMKVVCKRIAVDLGDRKKEIWVTSDLIVQPKREVKNNTIMPSVSRSASFRKVLSTGLIMRSGLVNDGRDLVFVCLPRERRKVFVPDFIRRKFANENCIGRWISFKLNENYELDDLSEIQIIDDIMPTRKYFRTYDIRVSCQFDYEHWNKRSLPVLYSDYCGKIVDTSEVLRRYGKINSFTGNAWIRNDYYQNDDEVKFILSELQEEWELDVGNEESASGIQSEELNSSTNNRGYHEQEPQLDDSKVRNKVERPSERPSERNSNTKWIMNSQTSKDFCNDGRSESSRKSDYSSDMTNQIDPKMRTENIFKKISFPHKPTDDFEDSDSEVEDSVYSTKQEPKSELEKLKFKYEYCTKKGLPVPPDVLQRLQEELEEEIKINKQKKIEDDDTRSSGISTSRESAATKVLQDEINKYKRVVKLAREFFEHDEVYDIMKSIDPKKANELINEIRNL